ncbi:MAG: 2OG-Fe(II) oxygenase [Actinomycetota bacterium]|nr:2OG-Fe(II) oxygenase [Actinomycetota bacterium]
MTSVGLERGERAPDFVLPGADGVPSRFYATAGGRPGALVFADEPTSDGLHSLRAQLDAAGVALFTVTRQPPDAPTSFAHWVDAEGRLARPYRLSPGSASTGVVALDANVRVLGSFETDEPATAAERVTRLLPPAETDASEVRAQAPVLLVPNALDADWCARLMDVWEREGNVETGVERTVEGRRDEGISSAAKRRRDHTVTDPQLLRELSSAVGRRVMPEVTKAFSYRATRFEGFKIGCYDASSGGFFRAHRDNLSPATMHRRFALTLNLNDSYTGGQLRFPEYGLQRYRPDAGAALVFSCSHLHEVCDVEQGRRFVLLSFLFSDADTRRSTT